MPPEPIDIAVHERIPRTQERLYPRGQATGPVDPAPRAQHRGDADLAPMALLREALVVAGWFGEFGLRIFAVATIVPSIAGAIVLLQLLGLDSDSAGLWGLRIGGGTWAIGLLLVGIDAVRTGRAWSTWMEPRAGSALRAAKHPSELLRRFGRHWRRVEAWRLHVGERELPVDVLVLRRSILEPRLPAAYVAVLRLPEDPRCMLGPATLERRTFSHGVERVRASGRELQLESIDLVDETRLHVTERSQLEWVQLLDPPAVALLADLDVEFACDSGELLVHLAAPRASWLAPDPRRLDALCLCVVELERRIATVLGGGAVAPAAEPFSAAVVARRTARPRATFARRHLKRERARDLAVQLHDPEALFDELARYASEEQVASVRAKVEAGLFPIDWLDDLVHHRRVAFWDAQDDAA